MTLQVKKAATPQQSLIIKPLTRNKTRNKFDFCLPSIMARARGRIEPGMIFQFLYRSQRAGYPVAMSLVIEPTQPVPLAASAEGVIRVAGTRVTLDTVAAAFEQGATAEEIVQQYPVLGLADVYPVLGYLLRHRSEVAAYLAERADRRAVVRRENERRFDPAGIRARLLARRPHASQER